MKNLTLMFNHFEQEHLGKDVFLVPYYLGKMLSMRVTIVYPRTATNKAFPAEIRGVRLVSLPRVPLKHDWVILKYLSFYWYLLCHASSIDVLMRFHAQPHTGRMFALYKLINPKGVSYVKLDVDPQQIDAPWFYPQHWRERLFWGWFVKYGDIYSCETLEAYNKILSSKGVLGKIADRLVLVPNGFDVDYIQELGLHTCCKKENIILTVGRLGTTQKNTSMLLRSIERCELRDWTVMLVGPVDKDFQNECESFLKRHEHLAGRVVFTGPIYEKRKLYSLYQRAKVFVLTSNWESFSIALSEAVYFGDYVISTPVGVAAEMLEHGARGRLVPINDDKTLSVELQQVIDGEVDIAVNGRQEVVRDWRSVLSPIICCLKQRRIVG